MQFNIVHCVYIKYIVAYRPVARQRPRNKQSESSGTRFYNNRITVGDGFREPVAGQLQQLDYKNGNGAVFYVIHAEKLS
jgi:hypothetical protein